MCCGNVQFTYSSSRNAFYDMLQDVLGECYILFYSPCVLRHKNNVLLCAVKE